MLPLSLLCLGPLVFFPFCSLNFLMIEHKSIDKDAWFPDPPFLSPPPNSPVLGSPSLPWEIFAARLLYDCSPNSFKPVFLLKKLLLEE